MDVPVLVGSSSLFVAGNYFLLVEPFAVGFGNVVGNGSGFGASLGSFGVRPGCFGTGIGSGSGVALGSGIGLGFGIGSGFGTGIDLGFHMNGNHDISLEICGRGWKGCRGGWV